MNFVLVQSDILPDRVSINLACYKTMLTQLKSNPDVIVFPEMFNCGFSPNLPNLAESLQGDSFHFLQSVAHAYHCDVVASMPIVAENKIFNRLYWINKEGVAGHYDKRHLFFGEEKLYCTAGVEKVIIQKEGIRFLPLICYDVRFPVWCRNEYAPRIADNEQFPESESSHFLYDCILIIANFPAQRAKTLRLLAQARAIENLAYVIVCNRVGLDGNNNPHSGNSVLINPLGKIVAEAKSNQEELLSVNIDMVFLEKLRRKFTVYKDWDHFSYSGF